MPRAPATQRYLHPLNRKSKRKSKIKQTKNKLGNLDQLAIISRISKVLDIYYIIDNDFSLAKSSSDPALSTLLTQKRGKKIESKSN